MFKSGRFKDMLSGEKTEEEILPEERQMIQSLIDETFEKFKKVVAEGRQFANEKNGDEGRKLVENWKEYADGRVLSGKQAYEYGFVDELGNFETAVETLSPSAVNRCVASWRRSNASSCRPSRSPAAAS